MKRNMKNLALVIVITILINGCTHAISNDEQINARGNTVGNIVNLGFVAQQGEWIYFCFLDRENAGLWKKNKENEKETIKLTNETTLFLNVVDDWIYYSSFEWEGLYKIRTDSTDRTEIIDDSASSYINVVDGWIYYSNGDDNHSLYKIRTDGSNRTKLNDDITKLVNVVDGWIYYGIRDDDNNNRLFRIRTDGTDRQLVE